jgi:uncharacterized phage protein gp47/JayE
VSATTTLDIDPGAFTPPFLETSDTVRARLLAAVPTGLSVEAGTWVDDFVEINVNEDVRGWAALNWMLAQCFPAWATGQQLDAHALSYGLIRSIGSYASGVVRFTATPGTAVIPSTVVEVPNQDPTAQRIQYETTNLVSVIVPAGSGYVDVPVVATSIGEAFNQPAGAVALLDTALGTGDQVVSAVSNLLPMVGGGDAEVDYDLRQRVLAQAQLPTGSGTIVDYIAWAKLVPGVEGVAVYGQWDTAGTTPGLADGRQNGSVILALLDSNNVPVDWSVVYSAQQLIDPSRQLIAMLDLGEGFSSPTSSLAPPAAPVLTPSNTGGVLGAGTYQVALTYYNSYGETTASLITSVTLTGTTSSFSVTQPATETGAAGWNLYVSQAGGAVLYEQASTANFTTPVTVTTVNASGAQPPTANSTAPVVWSGAEVQFGDSGMEIILVGATSVTMALSRGMDLSRFGAADGVFLWIYSTNWANSSPTTMTFETDAGDYYSITSATIAPTGTAAPSTGAGWWLWRVNFGQFAVTGTPAWSEITTVLLKATSSESVDITYDYWVARYNNGDIGVGGLAPIGADVTCISPLVTLVNIEVLHIQLQPGYTTTGSPGTTNIVTLIQNALDAYFNNHPPGLGVPFSDISQIISSVPGIIAFTLVLPASSGTPLAIAMTYDQYAQLGVLTVST